MSQFLQEYVNFMGVSSVSPKFAILFTVIAIWSLVWKGFALWKAARNMDKWWYVALLIINTVGILEILYIFIFSKRKNQA